MVAAVLVLLAISGFALDRWRAASETDRLVAAALQTESTIEYTRERLAALVEYQSFLLFREGVRPALRRSLLLVLAREAERSLPGLAEHRRLLERIDLLPWHADLRAARRDSLRRLDTWVQFLTRASRDAEELFRPPDEIERTKEVADESLRAVAATSLERILA